MKNNNFDNMDKKETKLLQDTTSYFRQHAAYMKAYAGRKILIFALWQVIKELISEKL